MVDYLVNAKNAREAENSFEHFCLDTCVSEYHSKEHINVQKVATDDIE